MRGSPAELFGDFPGSSRLWVFGVGRSLTPEEEDGVFARVDEFLRNWKAHGHPLTAACEWVYGRFLMVAVDDRTAPPSGCSIDALVRSLRSVEEDLGTRIVGGAPVWYREGPDDTAIRTIPRAGFAERAETGHVTGDTVVFDFSVTSVRELREGKWERPASDTWHRRYFSRRAAAP